MHIGLEKDPARGIVYGADNVGRVYAKAHQACVKYTPYMEMFDEDGREATSLAGAGTDVMIMVADQALSTGDYGWFVVEGDTTITTASDACSAKGYAFKVSTAGTVVCTDSAYSATGIDEFAVATATAASATTSHSVYMIPQKITWA